MRRRRSALVFTTLVSSAVVVLIAIGKARWLMTTGIILATLHVSNAQQPTVVEVTPTILHDQVIRLGMNLGGETFYGSSQILRNLVSRNPGFEGEEWQSVLQCTRVTPTSCADAYPSTQWPDGFLDGGSYEFILGAAKGQTGKVNHSTAVDKAGNSGVTVEFARGAKAPAVNDYLVVRRRSAPAVPGGWAPEVSNGGSVLTETTDLSPNTPGVQAVRLAASGPGQGAALSQFLDSTLYHAFVRFKGRYVLSFRAKGGNGNRRLSVRLLRLSPAATGSLFEKVVLLNEGWQDYTFTFDADEAPELAGTVSLSFSVYGSDALLDDVSLAASSSNGTAFRDEVVDALQRLHPGVLRYMDSGLNFGSSLDNMLAVEYARKRSGFSKYTKETDDIPIGLHDFLVLCEKIGAEPWYTLQMAMSEEEAAELVEYLGGPATTKYGAKRAAMGHPVPWTKVFPRIHLEFGNESWNSLFQGSAIPDPIAYAGRATAVFHAVRSSPWYSARDYDLIANGQAVNTWHNGKVIEAGEGFDSIDVAPYLFGPFSDDQSTERIFGPMFAEPEMLDSSENGGIHQQAEMAAHAKHSVHLAVYETNIGTTEGTVPQASIDEAVPSVGAGIAAIDHMLLMLRDDGALVQNTFQLTGYRAPFRNTKTHAQDETSPVWGVVVDLGGAANRVRPSFLAQQLANEAILPKMLATKIRGDDPTWDQPLSSNSNVELRRAHELQSFAFTDGKTKTLIVFNLSRTNARPILLGGENAPLGDLTVKTLTSGKITDNNESADNVRVAVREEHNVTREKTAFTLPPFSMTVFSSGRRALGAAGVPSAK